MSRARAARCAHAILLFILLQLFLKLSSSQSAPGDIDALRVFLASAASPGEVSFELVKGNYSLEAPLFFNATVANMTLTLLGGGSRFLCVGNITGSAIVVAPGASVVVNNITFERCAPAVVLQPSLSGQGSNVSAVSATAATFNGCTFAQNRGGKVRSTRHGGRANGPSGMPRAARVLLWHYGRAPAGRALEQLPLLTSQLQNCIDPSLDPSRRPWPPMAPVWPHRIHWRRPPSPRWVLAAAASACAWRTVPSLGTASRGPCQPLWICAPPAPPLACAASATAAATVVAAACAVLSLSAPASSATRGRWLPRRTCTARAPPAAPCNCGRCR